MPPTRREEDDQFVKASETGGWQKEDIDFRRGQFFMTNRVLRRKSVEALTGLSRATIYRHMRAGSFPRPIRLTERLIGWLEADIEEWLNSRARG